MGHISRQTRRPASRDDERPPSWRSLTLRDDERPPNGRRGIVANFEVHFFGILQTIFQCFYPNVTTYVRVFAIAIPSVFCLSVTLVYPTQRLEPFGNISSPLCTLAILWPPCEILRRSSQGNLSIGGIKHKRGNKIERWWTYRRLYLIKGTRQT